MLTLLALCFTAFADEPADPFLWLEDVEGDKALAWVEERNAAAKEALDADGSDFAATQQALFQIYGSDERIAAPSKLGAHWTNFWTDSQHPRGLWRFTTQESYLSGKPEWDVVIDVDKLGADEGVSWVWKGADCLAPAYERCLVQLSRGGADATVVREFDVPSRSFVEGGFQLPEAKGEIGWIDADTVFVGTDFGEGSMTTSGYPRIVKRWKRGTGLETAETVYEAQADDVYAFAYHDEQTDRSWVYRAPSFFTNQVFLVGKKGLQQVPKPDDVSVSNYNDWLLFQNRKPWTVNGEEVPSGSLVAAPIKTWMKGKQKGAVVLFTPTETTSLEGMTSTVDHVVLTILDDVKNQFVVLTPGAKEWSQEPLEGLPEGILSVGVSAFDGDHTNEILVSASGYTTPQTLLYGELGEDLTQIGQLPAFFDTAGLTVSQQFATSDDGTKVPYFIVRKEGAEPGPTLLYGYGGFEVSLRPGYSATVGKAWLEKGGTYVVANIRGGGEYGPRWHQAALREKRHKAYEDFSSVAKRLVETGVTTKDQLGVRGGSNGGLLTGNMLTQYPDLFGAVVIQVPLLDMRRYNKLLAGASWMGEYGNPDIAEEWAFIKTFSPYHNLDVAGVDYPPVLLTTSTRDDRVHPGHARKMAAALFEGGEDDVLYYENIEGGHGGAADNGQRAFMDTLIYSFLWDTLAPAPEPEAVEGESAEE